MKSIYSAILGWASKHWRGILSATFLAFIVLVILGFKIGSLIQGQNALESDFLRYLESFPSPWYRAVNAPYTIPAFLIGKLLGNMLLGAKLVSVFYSLVAAICIFLLAKLWFNVRIATVVLLLFITSSWLLAISHSATPLCLLVAAPLLLITPLAWFFRSKKHRFVSFLLFAAALAFAMYVPYMAWVAAIALSVLIIRERKKLIIIKSWQVNVSALVFLLLLLPLFYAVLHHPGQVKELIGIPQMWPSIPQYFANLGNLLLGLFIQSKALPALFLGKLPMLDFFSSAMFLFGLYYFVSRWPNRRSIIILSCMAILPPILAFSSHYQIYAAILLPFIYMTITVGFVELINQWVAYFPRNPLAKNFGIFLVVVSIGLISFYHLERFYVAWPNSPQVKSVYMVKSK